MAGTAAHLVDHIFPHVPFRQFLLSVPKRLRPLLHHRPRTASSVLHILLRALRSTLKEASPTAPKTAGHGGRELFSDDVLTPNTPYFYRTRACKGTACSTYSEVAGATTLRRHDPPSDLVTVPVSTTRIDLTWENNTDYAATIRLKRSPDGVSNWQTTMNFSWEYESYSNTGLAPGTRCFCRLRACVFGLTNSTEYSKIANAKTHDPAPQLS